MNFNEYQKEAFSFASTEAKNNPLLNGVLGISGEGGECADLIKKNLFQGHDLDKDKLAKELGDVLWYIAEVATGLGLSLEEIAKMNIDKLKNRYPNGFSSQNSINRKD